jgi:hypothetical protein
LLLAFLLEIPFRKPQTTLQPARLISSQVHMQRHLIVLLFRSISFSHLICISSLCSLCSLGTTAKISSINDPFQIFSTQQTHVIRLKRIYNFSCSILVLTPFA